MCPRFLSTETPILKKGGQTVDTWTFLMRFYVFEVVTNAYKYSKINAFRNTLCISFRYHMDYAADVFMYFFVTYQLFRNDGNP